MQARRPISISRFLPFAGAVLFATAIHAQMVNDGATTTLNNVTSNLTGTVTVGTNGSFTLLLLTNNALLTNSGHGVIGRNAGANSNAVRLTGGNTRWLMSLDHFVGSNGSFNRLVISNGARVENNFASLGVGTTSSNNEALVTGVGSLWSNRNDLYVGYLGRGNRLAVTNGGRVANGSGLLGVDVTSSNNEAVVTGAASLWSNRASLFVGFSGRGNRVVVMNSGSVFASNSVQIGVNAGSVSNFVLLTSGALLTNNGNGIIGVNGSSNSASLSGAGTRWLLGNNLYVGSNGAFNQLVVSNGALLVNGNAHLGYRSVSSNNVAVVTGAGSVWSNRAELDIGFDSDGNRLVVSSGGVVLNDLGVIGSGFSNQVLVTGTGTVWTNRTDLFVGAPGGGNLLVVSNGGWVFNRSGILGLAKASPNNEAVVTGTGSLWSNRQHVVVGGFGEACRLTVRDGGTVFAGTNVSVGFNAGSANNFLLLSSGALLTNNGNGIIGGETDANTNTVFATGVNTRWLLGNNLYVGSNGAFNQLVVSNGALLVNGNAHLGYRSVSSNNVAVVTGAGSVWSNRAELDIGFDSDGNRLVVSSGGVVLNDLGVIGSGFSNQVLVTGTGTVWTNRTDLFVGAPGGGNLLVVSNGGWVFNRSGILGLAKASPNNEAVVTGTGSLWSNRQHVVVGGFGEACRLTVRDGGTVFAGTNVSVGFNAGSANNFLLLSSGALLTNNGNGIIGGETDANTNTVFATGVNTRWLLGSSLYVGSNGAFNQLVVSNASSVLVSGGAHLGFSPGSTNNRIIVDGGTLRATNANNSGVLDVRRGTNELWSGLIEVDRLLVTNALGQFAFIAGTLVTENTTNTNGRIFDVGTGDGMGPASLHLAGNGTHVFGGGLRITSSGSLIGNGTIIGAVTVQPLGTLSPGASIGKLTLNVAPNLSGITAMEISRNGSVLTNDLVQMATSLNYGGALTVAKLGAEALTAGNRFQLFSATSYSGVFIQVTLPALASGLSWTNKLLLDGSIEVVPSGAPRFGSIVLSGTNVIISGTGGPTHGTYWMLASTNVALPLTNWTRLLTNQFDSSGGFIFTNARSPTVPRRFYVLQVP